MPNRLINETSPYLLQHANNPVDWYPWGEEALERARSEDKPILLSIGYSACHWCHVMERESFENETIAGLMNDNFISIKVDREERPDLDQVYMQAVQMLTGSGGWPMTVFLTPEGKPFYGGTYFPPEDRQGMPGFPRLLTSIAEAYSTNRGEIDRVTQQLTTQMSQSNQVSQGTSILTVDILHQAYSSLATNFDYQNGGFGNAPKFPQPMTPEFLLRYYHHGYNPRALELVELTLEKMAYGGITTRSAAASIVIHRRLLAGASLREDALRQRPAGSGYLHTYLITGRALYRRVVEETLDYVLREMTDSSGGFYSAQDADSEGVEGKFFVWSPDEINSVMGDADGEVFAGYYGVTAGGNFEGKNVLNIRQDPEEFAETKGLTADQLGDIINRGSKALLEVRDQRIHPMRDDKVLASWNGLMLRSFAEAAAALGRPDYLAVAIKNAEFLAGSMKSGGRLLRTYRDGQAKLLGYLEDYSFVIDGLLALYEATFDLRWLDEAVTLADSMIELFWDEGIGGFYDTGSDHETLVVRPRDVFDNAQPCGGSVASDVLLRLAVFTGNNDYSAKAAVPLRSLHQAMSQSPGGTGHWLSALDFYVSPPKEIAVIGPRDDPATQALLDTVFHRFLPNKVVMGVETPLIPAVDNSEADIPLLAGRGMVGGLPSAYVCQNYACQLPVTDPADLAEQLSR